MPPDPTAVLHRPAQHTSEPVAVSEAIRPVLTGAAVPIQVIAVFGAAVYLRTAGGQLLAVVTRDAARLPIAAVLGTAGDSRPFAAIRGADLGSVGGGRITIREFSAYAARWWNPRPVLLPVRPEPLAAGARTLSQLIADADVGWPAAALPRTLPALRDGIRRRDTDAAAAAVAGLIGLGPGLTPSGDDLLAGLLATLVCFDQAGSEALAVRILGTAAGRTTELSWALLGQAALGNCCAQVSSLLHAVRADHEVAGAYRNLRGVGHTSGAALALGVSLGIDLVLTAGAGPA